MVKKKFKVIVYKLPKRKFEKRFKEYGKHTRALSEEVSKKSTTGRVYIKNGSLSPKQFKKVMYHEVGHAVIDKTGMEKKFSKPEKKDIRALARHLYGKHRRKVMQRESPKEQLMEGLAWIYQKMRSGEPSEKKLMKKEYKSAYEEFRKSKRRLNVRVIKR